MRRVKFVFLFVWAFSLFLTSCERSEGEGGKASIEGTVYKIIEDGVVKSKEIGEQIEYYFERDTILAADADVYIIYGGDTTGSFDDRTRASFNGKFKFNYLVSGSYAVFAYSNLPNKKQTAQIRSLKIGDKGAHLVPDMYVWDGKNVGLSAIVGKIKVVYQGGEAPGAGLRVFIKEVGTVGPIDDVRADESGTFIFTRLNPNAIYDVWAESEPVKNGPIETVHVTVAVERESEIVCQTTDGTSIEIAVENEIGGATIEGVIKKIVDEGDVRSKVIDGETVYYFERDTIIASEEDVYLIFGNDLTQSYEEREKTSYNGKYQFRNLLPGDYSVFAYDNLPNKVKATKPYSIKVEGEGVYNVDTMYVWDGKNAGLSAIVGQVRARYNGTGSSKGQPVMGIRVYIKAEGSETILDDVRTNDKGIFVFNKLEPGVTYRVWAADEVEKGVEEPQFMDYEIPEENAGEVLNFIDEFILINIR